MRTDQMIPVRNKQGEVANVPRYSLDIGSVAQLVDGSWARLALERIAAASIRIGDRILHDEKWHLVSEGCEVSLFMYPLEPNGPMGAVGDTCVLPPEKEEVYRLAYMPVT